MGFHFHRKPLFQNIFLKTQVIFSSFSTLQFYSKNIPLIFQECSKKKVHKPGRQAHARMIVSGFKPTVFDATCLLHMYVKCSHLEYAVKVFDRMPERNYVSWNTMISGYSVNGKMGSAQSLFDLMPKHDVISWNSLISGYLQNGNCLKSVELFVNMGRVAMAYNETTFSVVFKACATLKDNVLGKQVHGVVVKSGFKCNVVIGTAMLDMYAKCDNLIDARKIFNILPNPNMQSYTALIVGYARGDRGFEGTLLFLLLLKTDLGFDEISLSAAFSACAVSKGLVLGTQMHGLAIKTPFHDNISVATAIIDMYGKCGALQEAFHIFDEMKSRNVVSWTTMVCAYAGHGHGNEALQVFEKMVGENVMPNHLTFTGILHACAHNGLLDEALHYLYIMKSRYGLEPNLHHYSCMVDALGRCGRINDALKLIEHMPLKADDAIWRSLLSNCKTHMNVKVAEIAARSLLQLDPQNYTAYVLLSQIYADADMWDAASKMRRIITRRRLKKMPGCSFIEQTM